MRSPSPNLDASSAPAVAELVDGTESDVDSEVAKWAFAKVPAAARAAQPTKTARRQRTIATAQRPSMCWSLDAPPQVLRDEVGDERRGQLLVRVLVASFSAARWRRSGRGAAQMTPRHLVRRSSTHSTNSGSTTPQRRSTCAITPRLASPWTARAATDPRAVLASPRWRWRYAGRHRY